MMVPEEAELSSVSREARISQLFVQLADTLIDDFDVVDFLHRLAESTIELL
jgi:hypothetical protein